jgi:hypothetical protein
MGTPGNPNWQHGVSGNPGGRSKELAQRQSAARLKAAEHADEVIGFLLKTLRDEKQGTAYRLKAGIELLNRGLGLPVAQVDIDVLVRKQISEMTLEELRQLEERLIGSTPAPPLLLESPSASNEVSQTDDDDQAKSCKN